jgi:uracil phosphoribosyltransferase
MYQCPCHALLPLMLLQVVPILRAGLVLLEQAATLLPAQETYHLGYVRDDETLQVWIQVQQDSNSCWDRLHSYC